MTSLLTVLIPGLAQIYGGDSRKGTTLLLCAIVAGVLSGGVGWLVCGVYSLVDFHYTAARPAAPAADAPPRSAPASAPKSGSGGSGVEWAFKFAILLVGGGITLYAVSQGQAIRTLDMFGFKVDFHSPLADAGERQGGDPEAAPDPLADAALPAGGSAMRPLTTPRVLPVSESAEPAPAPPPRIDLSGDWVNENDAVYHIAQSGTSLQIREMSRVYGVPIQTAACQGALDGRVGRLQCTTFAGTDGRLVLTVHAEDHMVGEYRDLATGAVLQMELFR